MISYYCFLLMLPSPLSYFFFFFNDTATTEIYTLSLHDALPISVIEIPPTQDLLLPLLAVVPLQLLAYHIAVLRGCDVDRSEEHTSELQSRSDLVCRLLLEKKKNEPQAVLLQPTSLSQCRTRD